MLTTRRCWTWGVSSDSRHWFWIWRRSGCPWRVTSFIIWKEWGRERGKADFTVILKLRAVQSGSYKYSFGFLEQPRFFFSSWNRAGRAPGDMSPGSVVSFILGAHSKERETRARGGCCCTLYEREGENSAQPFLWAFPASLVAPQRSVPKVIPSFDALQNFSDSFLVFFVVEMCIPERSDFCDLKLINVLLWLENFLPFCCP